MLQRLHTNAHFSRQLVTFMLPYKKYFHSLLKQSIMGIYGNERFTEEQLETLEKENLMTEEERKYKCTLCEKVYKYKSNTKTPSLRRPDPISCCKWDVSYFMRLKKKKNFYVAYAAIYSNNTLTNECWK